MFDFASPLLRVSKSVFLSLSIFPLRKEYVIVATIGNNYTSFRDYVELMYLVGETISYL